MKSYVDFFVVFIPAVIDFKTKKIRLLCCAAICRGLSQCNWPWFKEGCKQSDQIWLASQAAVLFIAMHFLICSFISV